MVKIYGKNVVKAAFNSGRKIMKVCILDSYKETGFLDVLKRNGINVEIAEKKEFDLTVNHQGIMAYVEDYKYYELDEVLDASKKQYFIILDGITDPHNLGAMLRSADATQIDGIIIPKNNTVPLNATVAKVSTGAIEYVKVIQVNNLVRTIEYLKTKSFWIIGTDMDGEKRYTDIDVSTSLGIVIGSEGEGMKRLVKDKCDYIVSIPMKGNVNSLNASVSAALLMYEVFRKR